MYEINLHCFFFFQEMAQYRKDMPDRKRKIKRDVVFAQCKGVAGLVPKNN